MWKWKWLILMMVFLTPLSCVAPPTGQRRPYLIAENLDYAAEHVRTGNNEEAAQLYQAVLVADPENQEARAALAKIGRHDPFILAPNLMGRSLVRRPRARSAALYMGAYPLSRAFDILDIVSVHVGLEGGLYAEAHVTDALRVAAGSGGGWQIGMWQKHNFAMGTGEVSGLVVGPIGLMSEGSRRAGLRGFSRTEITQMGLITPKDAVYQSERDYWSVGARVTVLLVGAEARVHLLELADALAGFFFVDFLRDDLGSARRLRLTPAEMDAMEDLMGTLTRGEFMRRCKALRKQPEEKESASHPFIP